MPGLIIDREEEDLVLGFPVRNWNDDPALKLDADGGRRRRTGWVRSIVLHTTKGIPGGRLSHVKQFIEGGKAPDENRELRIARMWSRDGKPGGAHLVIDTDGSVGCLADLRRLAAYHAGNKINEFSIGIEIFQKHDGGIYESSLKSAVVLVEALCRRFHIQRQFHAPYLGGPIKRLERGGADCVGVFGHRDITRRRGAGDPGNFIFDLLRDNGFEDLNFDTGEDLEVWKDRQEELGLVADGVPGPQTINAIMAQRSRTGIWSYPGSHEAMDSDEMAQCLGNLCEACPLQDVPKVPS